MIEDSRVIIEMEELDFLKIKDSISDLKKTLCNLSFTELKKRVLELDCFVLHIKYKGKTGRGNYRKPFSDYEKQQISTLKKQGVNIYKIAQQMDRPYNSIKNYIYSKSESGNI